MGLASYTGEIRMFAGNYPPVGWAFCDGQMLPVAEYESLFNLIGTTYGGDGQNNFALPDLRGRVPVGSDQLGLKDGAETVALSIDEIPSHRHSVNATTAYQVPYPSRAALPASAAPAGSNVYGSPGNNPTTLTPETIGPGANARGHNNIQPCLAVSFIIALFGDLYPTQT